MRVEIYLPRQKSSYDISDSTKSINLCIKESSGDSSRPLDSMWNCSQTERRILDTGDVIEKTVKSSQIADETVFFWKLHMSTPDVTRKK